MAVYSSNALLERLRELKPVSILGVVPRKCFVELGKPGYEHIGNGNAFEWKYAVAKLLQPKRILEIGVRFGYSACCFIEGSDAVESYTGWDSEIYVPGSNAVAEVSVNLCRRKPKATFIKRDSSTVHTLGGEFDLVHIDSSHQYEICLRDLRLCYGFARAILVDDTMTCPDDARAVRDFCHEHESAISELVHIHSHVGETLILLK